MLNETVPISSRRSRGQWLISVCSRQRNSGFQASRPYGTIPRMTRNVYLCQPNYRYGSNVFLPYSAGCLQAYCQTMPEITGQYEFAPIAFLREPVNEFAERMQEPSVLALSCYIWNWEYSKALAEAVKQRHPDCFVVLGGTQVPRNAPDFFREHPYVDAAVYHEGELTFAGLLRTLIDGRDGLRDVQGLVLNIDGEPVATPPAARIQDLSALPSPYLSGVFDSLLNEPFQFQANQETHRGCPYECTFCDWGAATMTKVRRFPRERILAEYEWFADHEIELLYNCDANYGLFKDDLELTERLVDVKRKRGNPQKFRAAYAKNSNQRVFEIASRLNEEGMCKGVTLSFQSIDEPTLEVVRRKNMRINDFRGLITQYRRAGIPTYTELILGLPGETYETFADGIETLLEAGQHDSLNVFHCMLLPNSEMNQPAYQKQHEIVGVRVPMLLLHGSNGGGDIPEYYDIVVETATMPLDDWTRKSVFAWTVQALHCLNLTQVIAVAVRHRFDMSYRTFYETLIAEAGRDDTVLGQILDQLETILADVRRGRGGFEFEDSRFDGVSWPVEEAVFLKLCQQRDEAERFDREIRTFLGRLLPEAPVDLLDDLVSYQRAVRKSPHDGGQRRILLGHDVHSYVSALLENGSAELVARPTLVSVETGTGHRSFNEFAREVVWYGRKGNSLRHWAVEAALVENDMRKTG